MPGELIGDVPRSRRMPRQICEHGTALLDPSVGIGLADHRLFARLVQALDENKLPAMVGLAKPHPRPPGEHFGETRDVVLRITGADAERVQLQNFASKVFVQALVAVDAGDRIRAHGFQVIEINQHGRMAFDCGQHVDEAAKDVRAYRLAFIGTGHRKDLVGRNTEVIGPKPNKALDEADLAGDGGFDADFGLVLNELSRQWRRLLALLGRSRFRLGSLRIPVWFHRSVVGRAANFSFACRSARNSKKARAACPLLGRFAAATRPAPGRSRSASNAPRGSSAIAAIEPATGPKPNRCNASAASSLGLVVMLSSRASSSILRRAHLRSISRKRRAAFEFHQRWHGRGHRGVIAPSKETFRWMRYLMRRQGSQGPFSRPLRLSLVRADQE